MKRYLLFILVFACTTSFSRAESLADYVNRRLAEQIAAGLAQKKPDAQTDAISLNQGSTSFVDQTSAADFVGVGMNLAGVGPKDNSSNTQAVSASVTLYALYAGALRKDPMDADFYRTNGNLRRLSFTLGREDGVADNPDLKSSATLSSMKVLIVNQRDVVSLIKDTTQMDKLRSAANQMGGVRSRLVTAFLTFLQTRFASDLTGDALRERRTDILENVEKYLGMLSDADRRRLDDLVNDEIEREIKAQQSISEVYDVFKRKPQVSLDFQTSQRPGKEADLYRGELIADYGLLNRVSATVNGSWEYTDRKRVGADLRGGRVAGELRLQLSGDNLASIGNPVMFSVSGEGKWISNSDMIYRIQGKLTLPLTTGIDLPLSFGYASKAELLKESGPYGKFGLAFDFGKLISMLHNSK